MVDQTKTHECSLCGEPGGPEEPCPSCGDRPAKQLRQYTLSELRAMDPEQRKEILQGNRPSGSAPRIANVPGSLGANKPTTSTG